MNLFIPILSEHKKPTKWVFVRKKEGLLTIKKVISCGKKIIGISSNKSFPKYTPDIIKYVKGWCHCFRDPQKFGIPKYLPQILLSESDFVDTSFFKPKTNYKDFDFVYVCQGTKNQMRSKNLDLFYKCLPVLVSKLGLKGLLIGMQEKKIHDKYGILCLPKMSKIDFFRYLCRSRFLFVPNIIDASPRIITEAMSLNVPCIINNDILGGWKYINQNTGYFFCSEHDIENSVLKLFDNKNLRPKKYYYENWGPSISSTILSKFINELEKEKKYSRCFFNE